MAKFKPGCWIRNNSGPAVYMEFIDYRILKRSMVDLFNEHVGNEITVSRSKRGEWGEYFEIWSLVNGKPKIIKEGWM